MDCFYAPDAEVMTLDWAVSNGSQFGEQVFVEIVAGVDTGNKGIFVRDFCPRPHTDKEGNKGACLELVWASLASWRVWLRRFGSHSVYCASNWCRHTLALSIVPCA